MVPPLLVLPSGSGFSRSAGSSQLLSRPLDPPYLHIILFSVPSFLQRVSPCKQQCSLLVTPAFTSILPLAQDPSFSPHRHRIPSLWHPNHLPASSFRISAGAMKNVSQSSFVKVQWQTDTRPRVSFQCASWCLVSHEREHPVGQGLGLPKYIYSDMANSNESCSNPYGLVRNISHDQYYA